MLKLYRYLATASALLLLAAMGLIAWLYNNQATRDLVDLTARYNIAIDTILSNTIWAEYEDYLAIAADMDGETLRARPETAEIRDAVKMATEGISALKVKIYSARGLILFSSDPQEIGEDYSHSEEIQAAVLEGRISSELSFEDRLSAFSGELFDRDVVETYLPKYDSQGRINGVFELYSDVTDVKERIDLTTIRLTLGVAAIFSLVYVVLVVGVMRRAIEPIRLASRRAAAIGPDSSGVRLPVRNMPREILPLIRAINGALKRLDGALDAQRRFTADAAHELLTPLAVLRAQTQALGAHEMAEPMRRDIDAMTEMIHQLLHLAELEASIAATGEGEQADLHCVAVEVVSLLAPLAIQDGKELSLSGDAGPAPVRGSSKMLNQILRNLIENALRHTPRDTTVDVHIEAGGLVRVSDQGPGVPDDIRIKVFERFWRGDRTTEKGAGLGLSIVKRIVQAVGGEIRIEDAPGGGACFVVRFSPVEDQPGAAD